MSATEKVTAQVPINLVGESPAARETGGSVAQALYNLDVEALPLEIPNEVVIDLSILVDSNSVVRAGDLELDSNVTMLTDPEAMVVRVDAGRLALAAWKAPKTKLLRKTVRKPPPQEKTAKNKELSRGFSPH